MSKQKQPCQLITHQEIRPGDTGFARTNGLLGLLIRIDEFFKWRNGKFNHAFTVVSHGDNANDIWIVQATLKGVVLSRLQELMDNSTLVEILPAPEGADRKKIIEFAHLQVGDPYGVISDVCIGVDILTPEWFWSVRRNGTWICSALAGEAIRYSGYYINIPDIYSNTPTQLYIQLGGTL